MVDTHSVAGLDSAFWSTANSFEPHTAGNRQAAVSFLLPKWPVDGGIVALDVNVSGIIPRMVLLHSELSLASGRNGMSRPPHGNMD
jgi:hypothetical protein